MSRAVVLGIVVALTACRGGDVPPGYVIVTGGNPNNGRAAIYRRHCGVCHDIPGVFGSHGVIGPPLANIAKRSFVAGVLPNSSDNLVRWIRTPRSIVPRTAMPNLGIDEPEARDIAAYLYQLR